jgi:hypothetical protein
VDLIRPYPATDSYWTSRRLQMLHEPAGGLIKVGLSEGSSSAERRSLILS